MSKASIGRRAVLAAPLLAVAAQGTARAQPIAGGRPIRIVVPFGAGGTVDIVGRLVAQELSPRLGQPVVVENRTGAGGNIAMEHVARSQPDGTTLLIGSPSAVTNRFLYANLTYEPATQLAPIGLVAQVPSVMVAAPGFEAEDARRFVELARARPGHFTFGSGGAGTSEHLAAELLKARTGTDLVHVPYRGGAPALVDLQAGRISMMFSNLSMVLPHVQAGRLKALGIADAQRSPALPDVPTLSEQGIDEVNVTVWWGLMGPAGMPEEIVARLSGALSDALGSAGMRQSLEGMNAQIRPGTPAEFAQFLEREGARWGEVIRAAGIRAD